MRWKNLQDSLCPQCDHKLGEKGDMMKCQCGFMVKTKRALEIINNMANPLRSKGRDETEENLSGLNNI